MVAIDIYFRIVTVVIAFHIKHIIVVDQASDDDLAVLMGYLPFL